MKRVLLVSATAKRGGAERSLASLARCLPAYGWEPVTALLEDGPLEEWLEGTDVRRVPAEIDAVAALADGCDAILSNKWRGQLLGGPAADRAGLPSVWWQQDFPDASPAELLDGSVRPSVVVCSSDTVVAEQRRLAPWSQTGKIQLGIDVAEVAGRSGSGAAVRSRLGADGPLVGTVGWLEARKRQDVFLRAAALVPRPDARFAVVGGEIVGGEGEYADSLEPLAQELGIADRVVFAGHQADAYAWLDAFDVLVHPAEREPFGLVLVEALALGKPVVAVDTAGPAEILEDGRSGVLVPSPEPDVLAAGIERALADPPAPALARARACVFTQERMTREFAQVLDGLA